ncbi:4-(cytidine 5'-diphospho)-2-C-methyl-D-erythritol kinase [Zavarzinia compransoris]|uniref:4-diphosphocytidyl-2-C-methyl-D-erythritol kinase n=1 Tax=Zavarzinia compransoris TaxID=1264899 RepID=A0A317ECL5_9PROT|nr:4-(cytidine 5'-diphospho)-2-C-methyl-D-erythritol kinase [Zavarzinia compransoris]PWR24016.1 4-(cytidine 5'-diphospho)-2-C-methyl-D-erythritol kinase [Zavarzinia compransoris]TDP48276.1 4-diphosphocytidyl-2-C-methyl-D-erythritol kinase [Zavarzinia compransoris]
MSIDPGFPVAEAAPAKVNLYLHVTGRRDDGYHLLDSLVAFAETGDLVEAGPAGPGVLDLDLAGPFGPALAADGGDNLVLRAARGLRAALGEPALGARLRLTKVLPVAAGIGGGSSDAAAALRALCRLWRRELDSVQLSALALGLGADVPVCLGAVPAHMAGIGDRVEPVAGAGLAGLGLVLVNPGAHLPTPAVFRALGGRFGAADRLDPLPDAPAGIIEALAGRRNDLEAPAIGQCPIVADVLALLRGTDGVVLARMSGSGATCFGLCPDRAAALRAAAEIRRMRPAWWAAGGGMYKGREAP